MTTPEVSPQNTTETKRSQPSLFPIGANVIFLLHIILSVIAVHSVIAEKTVSPLVQTLLAITTFHGILAGLLFAIGLFLLLFGKYLMNHTQAGAMTASQNKTDPDLFNKFPSLAFGNIAMFFFVMLGASLITPLSGVATNLSIFTLFVLATCWYIMRIVVIISDYKEYKRNYPEEITTQTP